MVARVAFVALLTVLGGPATAQGASCADRALVVERLAEKFGETLAVVGLEWRGQVMEIYANPSTGSWTVLMTLPSGVSCMMSSGKGWQVVARPQGTAL